MPPIKLFLRLFILTFICAGTLTGCSSTTPFEKVAFPGRLLVSYNNGNTHHEQVYEIAQGNKDSLMWETQITGSAPGFHELTVSPGQSYAFDQGHLVSIADGHFLNANNPLMGYQQTFAFSPDDKYVAYASVDEGMRVQEIPSMKIIQLTNPKCQIYSNIGAAGGTSACLWMGSAIWLDGQTLLFPNDQGLFANDFQFPKTLTTGSGGYVTVWAGDKGNEVSLVDLSGKVRHVSNDPNFVSFLKNNQFLESGNILLSQRDDVWVSKQDLKQGIFNPHKIPAPAGNADISIRVLSPKGRYYLRFPSDMVDLETGKTIDLQISKHFNSKGAKYTYNGESVEIPSNCVWHGDEQQAVCGFVLYRAKGDSLQPVSILVFLSTNGAAPVFTELSSPSTDISLEAWLP